MSINIKELKALLKLFDESDSAYLSLTQGEMKIKMKKQGAVYSELPGVKVPTFAEKVQEAEIPVKERAASPEIASKERAASENGVKVTSPLVGVFYASKEPGAEPFVREGDRIEKGAVLCILESMKMLHEIKSPISGIVSKICLGNESLVEYGQLLFVVEEHA